MLRTVLSTSDIRQDASSYVDPQGYVFHYDGEIYRYVHPGKAPLYRRLLREGVLDELREHGLVATHKASVVLEAEPDGLVLHHQRVWPLSYCVEWCPSMLREAGLATLELAIALVDRGLMLQDAYPWNVLFDGSRAVFVDLTSLVPPDPEVIWPAHEQFEAFFHRPLVLAAQGRGDVARAQLYNNIGGIDLDAFHRLVSGTHRLLHPGLTLARWLHRSLQRSTRLKNRIREMSRQMAKHLTANVRRRFFQRLARRLESLRFPSHGDPWKNYYAQIDPAFDKQAKVNAVREIVTRLAPKTVLDLGCNAGVFSLVAAECGARVVSVDSSPSCIEALFHAARRRSLPVTPLLSDVLCPTPAYGFLGKQYPSLPDRVRSEMVLCLGLMHHLHLTGRQSWERIVELVDALSTRTVLFEFVAMDDANIDHLPQRREIDYTLESVIAALRTRFRQIDVQPSDRETRRLLVCRK
jgi:SAM-dependent methyltransferase